MGLVSFLFWALVAVTLLVSVRWGAMIGLIGFVFALLIGAVAVAHWAPPRTAASAGASVLRADAGQRPAISIRTSVFSMH